MRRVGLSIGVAGSCGDGVANHCCQTHTQQQHEMLSICEHAATNAQPFWQWGWRRWQRRWWLPLLRQQHKLRVKPLLTPAVEVESQHHSRPSQMAKAMCHLHSRLNETNLSSCCIFAGR
jgi:hypothetical protein